MDYYVVQKFGPLNPEWAEANIPSPQYVLSSGEFIRGPFELVLSKDKDSQIFPGFEFIPRKYVVKDPYGRWWYVATGHGSRRGKTRLKPFFWDYEEEMYDPEFLEGIKNEFWWSGEYDPETIDAIINGAGQDVNHMKEILRHGGC